MIGMYSMGAFARSYSEGLKPAMVWFVSVCGGR